MNYRYDKANAKKTVYLEPFGAVPIKDAKQDVSTVLGEEHIKKGNRHRPDSCAIALCIRDSRQLFPGRLLGAWVFKSHTLIVTVISRKLQALRYVNQERARKAINGFDNKQGTLQAGDVVTHCAPKGRKRLGVSNGRSNPGNVVPKKPRDLSKCHKRGVFVDEVHRQQVEAAANKRASVV